MKINLTEHQESYWLGDLDKPDPLNSYAYFEYSVNKKIDINFFIKAVNKLIYKHIILKAGINDVGEMVINNNLPDFEINTIDSNSDIEQRKNSLIKLGKNIKNGYLFDLNFYDGDQYILGFVFSLIISDIKSHYIIAKDILEIYSNLEKAIKPLREEYLNLKELIQNTKTTNYYSNSKNYWRQKIHSIPPAPELPLNWIDAGEEEMDHFKITFSNKEYRRLEKYAKENQLSISFLIFTKYAYVLNKWSGNDKFSIPFLIDKRPVYKLKDNVIFNFTDIILIEFDFSIDESFLQRSKSIQKQFWEKMSNCHYSGVEVIRDINSIIRENGEFRIFPYTFAINPVATKDKTVSKNDLDFRLVEQRLNVNIWLDVQVYLTGENLEIAFDFFPGKFPKGMIKDIIDYYKSSLISIEGTGNAVAQLIEKQIIKTQGLHAFDENQEKEYFLHKQLVSSIKKYPDKVAIVFKDEKITYGDLGILSNKIANYILTNYKVGTHIGILMSKGWKQVATSISILKAGCVFVPIDSSLPKVQIEHIIENSDLKLVINESLNDIYDRKEQIDQILFDTIISLTKNDTLEENNNKTSEELAYIIYTSGTTGMPKGVMISHESAGNTVFNLLKRFKINQNDSILSVSNFSFDLSIFDVYGILGVGGTLIIPEYTRIADAKYIFDLIQTNKITVWNSTPILFGLLKDFFKGLNNSKLRIIFLSGDVIPMSTVKSFYNNANVPLISLGGATECSIWSIIYEIKKEDITLTKIPYGKPLENQSVAILDKQLNHCPFWVIGEICIGGRGLAKGYINNHEKTKLVFLDHPQLNRVYLTGDLGFLKPDGNVEIIGRKDTQVKFNGHRIELSGIETVMESHENVSSSVVCIKESEGNQYLVAFFVKKGHIEENNLREYCSKILPDYMVPNVFYEIENFNTTHNGKLDRASLKLPDKFFHKESYNIQFNDDNTFLALKLIWKEILKLDEINDHDDDFFRLGGNSIMAIRLINKIESAFKVNLNFTDLIENPSLAKLKKLIAKGTKKTENSVIIPLNKSEKYSENLFLIHPIGGSATCFKALSENIDFNLYGVQSPGYSNNNFYYDSVENMADNYLEEIVKYQPKGPYNIGGYSFGGSLAFEIVKKMERLNEKVKNLYFFDVYFSKTLALPKLSKVALFKSYLADVLDVRVDESIKSIDDYSLIYKKAYDDNLINFSINDMDKILNIYECNYYCYHKYKIKGQIHPDNFIEFIAINSLDHNHHSFKKKNIKAIETKEIKLNSNHFEIFDKDSSILKISKNIK